LVPGADGIVTTATSVSSACAESCGAAAGLERHHCAQRDMKRGTEYEQEIIVLHRHSEKIVCLLTAHANNPQCVSMDSMVRTLPAINARYNVFHLRLMRYWYRSRKAKQAADSTCHSLQE
jgi:hypothetical protein